MTNFLKISAVSFFLFGLVRVNSACAALVPCGTEADPEACTLCHLWELISEIINFISFSLAIPVAVLLFVIAGILFVVSGGNEQRTGLARTIFTNTIIGLVIIFCSWLLIDTLVKTIAGDLKGIIGAWNDFPTCE